MASALKVLNLVQVCLKFKVKSKIQLDSKSIISVSRIMETWN